MLGFCYFPSKIYKKVAKLLCKMTVSNKLSVPYPYVLSPVRRKDMGNFIFRICIHKRIGLWKNRDMEEKERGSYPSDLTDEQWEEIAPLYTGMRNCTWSKRELTDAVLYLVDSGCKWRQLPHDFPPYSTVHSFYRRARIRACLKIVNTPNRRAFFRRAALLCLEIHKVFLRQIALPGEKIPCRWAYCQFSNGA